MEDHSHIFLRSKVLSAVYKSSPVSLRNCSGDLCDLLFGKAGYILSASDLVICDVFARQIQISQIRAVGGRKVIDLRTSLNKLILEIGGHFLFRVIRKIPADDTSNLFSGRNASAFVKRYRKSCVDLKKKFSSYQYTLPHKPVYKGQRAPDLISQRGKKRSHFTSEPFRRETVIGPARSVMIRKYFLV